MKAEAKMLTVAEFIKKHGIGFACEGTNENPNMEDSADMHHWLCTLTRGAESMEVHFSMGSAHQGKEPEAAEVLDCLASDSAGLENNPSFEDWAEEYGYDADSRKAEKTYQACLEQAEKLKAFLGADAFEELLYHTERE